MGEAIFEGWALLELMGHRQVPGYVKEVELAGAKFFRVRVPGLQRDLAGRVVGLDLEKLQLEQFYSPASVYALTPTTEWAVRRALEREARWSSLPALPPPGTPQPASCAAIGCTSQAEPGSTLCWSHGGDTAKSPPDASPFGGDGVTDNHEEDPVDDEEAPDAP